MKQVLIKKIPTGNLCSALLSNVNLKPLYQPHNHRPDSEQPQVEPIRAATSCKTKPKYLQQSLMYPLTFLSVSRRGDVNTLTPSSLWTGANHSHAERRWPRGVQAEFKPHVRHMFVARSAPPPPPPPSRWWSVATAPSWSRTRSVVFPSPWGRAAADVRVPFQQDE